MMQQLTIRARLLMLVGAMLAACLVIGLTGLNAQQRSVAGLNTVYLDRVVPLRDLKLIADLYAVKIVDTTHKTRSGMLSYPQARDEVRSARAEISRLWSAYMNTRLVDAERQIASRIETLMKAADEPLDALERTLDRHSEKRLAAFVINDLYPLIDPISEGFNQLIELQLGEAKAEYEQAQALYQRNRLLNIGLLLALLVGGGLFATVMLRSISRPLDELKQADNTLVFFTSDNGPETLRRYGGAARSFGSPGPLRGMKLWLFEGGIRVPGILRFPGRIQPGSESDEPVCGLDVLPTLTALAGIERKPDRAIDGTSFVEVFTGKPIRRVTPLYWHYYNALGAPKAAMRAGDWMVLGSWGQTDQRGGGFFRESDQKLVKTMELKHFELYNLKRDRDQKKNLAETEPARLKELSVQLVKKYREVQAEGPEWKFGK